MEDGTVGRIVAFLNRKGGVGKTSTCHHLGGALAAKGRRVLLVDADPQASLTQGLLGPEAARELRPRETIAALYGDDADDDAGRLVRKLAVAGLSLLPGSGALDKHNFPEPWKCGGDQYLLRDALGDVRDDYDAILIDCPPHAYLSAWSALVAADGVVVPLQAEDYGAQGIASILETIDHVQAGANPRLKLLGYLVTMFNKSLGVHVGYDRDLRAIYGDDVFATTIPLAKDFKESVMLRVPVCAYKPKSAASKAVAALADELLSRLGGDALSEDGAEHDARRVA
jgi:chromosome partitioning protein